MMHQMLSSNRIKRKEDPSKNMITIFEKSIETMKRKVEEHKVRSQWAKGVKLYALELLTKLEDYKNNGAITNYKELEKIMINDCNSWLKYSNSGTTLYYNFDIARRLMTTTEQNRWLYGTEKEIDFLKLQAQALEQAFNLVYHIAFRFFGGKINNIRNFNY